MNKLLKEYVKLLVETDSSAIFKMTEPSPPGSTAGDITIVREFIWDVDPSLLQKTGQSIQITPEGFVGGAHQLVISAETIFQKSRFRGSREQPADPDEFDVENWHIESVDGVELSYNDSERLKTIIDGLSDSELEELEELARDRANDYDPEDYY